jgi:hypothetical protein
MVVRVLLQAFCGGCGATTTSTPTLLLRPEPLQLLSPRVAFPGARAAPLWSSAFGPSSPGWRSGVAAAAASLLQFCSGSVPDRPPSAVVLVLACCGCFCFCAGGAFGV